MNDAIAIAASLLLLAAAAWDVMTYRIPNVLCAALAALFVAHAALHPAPAGLVPHLVPAALAFLGGALLFARGLFGGGDVKLLAAAVLWVPPPLVLPQITLIAMLGGVLALALLAARCGARRLAGGGAGPERLPELFRDGAPIPYGLAIAFGTLAYLPAP